MIFRGEDLLKWAPVHGTQTRLTDFGYVLSDIPEYNWHLVRISSQDFIYRKVRIRILVEFLPGCSASLYFHHLGSIDIADVSMSGDVVKGAQCMCAEARRVEGGLFEVEVEFLNFHESLSIGCAKSGRAVYEGDGTEQFCIREIEVTVSDASDELSELPEHERIRLVDVGGQEGLQLKWALQGRCLTPTVFEPIHHEAEALKQTLLRIPGATVIEAALAHQPGQFVLNITKASGCSSLREPDVDLCSRYSIGHIFDVVERREVDCVRYDDLFARGIVPAPDAIKIDVQGFEYEVLLGFGGLLSDCIGIEAETHFYRLYKGQKLIGDLVEFLKDFDFVLRRMDQVPNFDGDAVEFNAFFMKSRRSLDRMPEAARRKAKIIAETWGL